MYDSKKSGLYIYMSTENSFEIHFVFITMWSKINYEYNYMKLVQSNNMQYYNLIITT